MQQKEYFVAVLHRFYVSHCVLLCLISNDNNNNSAHISKAPLYVKHAQLR